MQATIDTTPIAIPARTLNFKPKEASPERKLIASLHPGASVFFPLPGNSASARFKASIIGKTTSVGKKFGRTFVSREMEKSPAEPILGVRVWRTK